MHSIKDNLNHLTFNQWSATEYSNNFNGFGQLGVVESSKDYSIIGETSLKLTKNSEQWWFDVMLSSLEEGTYNLTVNVYLKSGTLRVMFYNQQSILTEIWYNNMGHGTISLSATYAVVDDARVRFTIYGEDDPTVFVDNLSLI